MRNTILISNESIDIRNAYKLKEEVQETIDEGYKEVSLDFTNVKRVDSAGIGKLLVLQKRLQEQGGMLKIINVANKYLRQKFNMIQLHRVIPIVEKATAR